MAPLAILILIGICGVCPGAAQATPATAVSVSSLAEPTNFSSADTYSSEGRERCLPREGAPPPQEGGACDRYTITVTNTSSEPLSGPITITDTLPSAGLTVANVEAYNLESGAEEQVEGEGFDCNVAAVACTYTGTMAPGDILEMTVRVFVAPGAPGETVENHASVSSEAGPLASTSRPATMPNTIDSEPPGFGVQDFGFQAFARQGTHDPLAGDHPYQATSTFDLNSMFRSQSSKLKPFEPVERVKDVVIELPLGFVSDPLAAPRCPESSLVGSGAVVSGCPSASRVGSIAINLGGYRTSSLLAEAFTTGLYNLSPDGGYPAEFGADVVNEPVVLYGQVLPTAQGYRLRVLDPGILNVESEPVDGISLTFFGDPGEQDASGTPTAFLTNPTACSGEPLTASIYADSWSNPGRWIEGDRLLGGPNGPASEPLLLSPGWVKLESTAYPEIAECDALQFNPTASVTPSTTQADEPSGYAVDIEVPQAPGVWPDRATPDLKDATVTFPPGVSISPAAADGLQSCTEEQLSPMSAAPASCPQSSQIGTATITSPLLPAPLTGQIFLRTPECASSACEAGAEEGRMFGLFVQAEGSGVNIKLKGRVEVGTGSAKSLAAGLQPGQLRARFDENPQLPVSDLHLQFDGGEHAPLANPQVCGEATTSFQLTPWSAEAPEERNSSFQVDWNGEAGACPATEPFEPSFASGLSYTNAGAFSPFTLTVSRGDREQDLSAITVHTPDGVGAMLASVPRCEESEAEAGACPAASEIGDAQVAIGAGPQPFWLPQPGQPSNPVYLTGPYGGAPFGLAIVVHANAGPFQLGDVVVRAGISIDPQTAALEIAAGPLPQILDGIPLRMRTVSVDIDRPGFMFAPTDCTRQSVTATIASSQGAAAAVSSPFDVGGCQDLPFKPKLSASTAGSGSFAGHGASLDVKIAAPAEGAGASSPEANLRSVHVELPRVLPTRLSTLQHACTAAQFAASPAGCPASSIVGSATIDTPTLPVPLRGPAYLVSHGGAAFPDLVLVTKGDGVTIQLTGKTEIKGGATYTHFDSLPDSPISSFELNLPEGPHSVLAATANLCRPATTVTVTKHVIARSHGRTRHLTIKVKEKVPAPLSMPTRIEAQNNSVLSQATRVAITGCPKHKPKIGMTKDTTK